jgi:hypothetical protein
VVSNAAHRQITGGAAPGGSDKTAAVGMQMPAAAGAARGKAGVSLKAGRVLLAPTACALCVGESQLSCIQRQCTAPVLHAVLDKALAAWQHLHALGRLVGVLRQ